MLVCQFLARIFDIIGTEMVAAMHGCLVPGHPWRSLNGNLPAVPN